MADDLDFEVFGRLSMEQLQRVDFEAPVTRSELMQAMMAVHEALVAQVYILQVSVATNPNVSDEARKRAAKAAEKILKKTGSLIQGWAGVPEPEPDDDE